MTYTELQMEAALCVWEYMLQCRYENNGMRPEFHAMFDRSWTVAMRHIAIEIGVWAETVYNEIKRIDPKETVSLHSYDWDVIPAIVNTIDWNGGVNKPSIQDAARLALDELKSMGH